MALIREWGNTSYSNDVHLTTFGFMMKFNRKIGLFGKLKRMKRTIFSTRISEKQ